MSFDLSLSEFAKRLDCSPAFVSDIELGRRHPVRQSSRRYRARLGVTVEELRALDLRAPIDEIKRITQDDPTFALAFRTVIDKNVSAEELLDNVKRQESEGGSLRTPNEDIASPSRWSEQPHFTPSQIDRICCDQLRNTVSPQYAGSHSHRTLRREALQGFPPI